MELTRAYLHRSCTRVWCRLQENLEYPTASKACIGFLLQLSAENLEVGKWVLERRDALGWLQNHVHASLY